MTPESFESRSLQAVEVCNYFSGSDWTKLHVSDLIKQEVSMSLVPHIQSNRNLRIDK